MPAEGVDQARVGGHDVIGAEPSRYLERNRYLRGPERVMRVRGVAAPARTADDRPRLIEVNAQGREHPPAVSAPTDCDRKVQRILEARIRIVARIESARVAQRLPKTKVVVAVPNAFEMHEVPADRELL